MDGFDRQRKHLAVSSINLSMNMERPLVARTEETAKRVTCSIDLPPTQAGLAAALRCAFAPPRDDAAREFEALLRKLA
jgi:hypothetical protein